MHHRALLLNLLLSLRRFWCFSVVLPTNRHASELAHVKIAFQIMPDVHELVDDELACPCISGRTGHSMLRARTAPHTAQIHGGVQL